MTIVPGISCESGHFFCPVILIFHKFGAMVTGWRIFAGKRQKNLTHTSFRAIVLIMGVLFMMENDKQILDYAETLGEPIQRFADVLENELKGIICF